MAENENKRTWEKFYKMIGEKRRSNGSIKAKSKFLKPSSIMVQRMSSSLDTRDFVDFLDYDELSIDNIRDACKKFYDMPQGSCDVLLSDRRLSCFLSEQISGRKFYYVRFTTEVGKQYNPRATRVKLPGGIEIGNQGATASMSFGNAMLNDEYKQIAKPGNTSSLP